MTILPPLWVILAWLLGPCLLPVVGLAAVALWGRRGLYPLWSSIAVLCIVLGLPALL